MIYFDNAATTSVNDEVLDTFVKVSKEYIGNANSIHKLGFESKKLMNASIKQVTNLLKIKDDEIIFTSSSSESNNLAIKGVLESYPNRKRIILTTILEHPSITNTLNSLKDVEVINLKLDATYHIDIDDLKEKLKLDPILVSIHHVNSELGIIQDIDTIGKIIKENSKAIFHVDGTQSLTKLDVNLSYVDLFSASAHKFNGLKGIAILTKKEKVNLSPIINGGDSQTIYRAGTPPLPLIASFAKALRLALEKKDEAYLKVKEINNYLKDELSKLDNITINSKPDSSPYILNFSIKGIKPETMIHKLEAKDVYLSTKTACSSKEDYSKSIYELTKDKEISRTSLRLSLSKDSTMEEAKEFIKTLKNNI
jgi:cysteine desulfurase